MVNAALGRPCPRSLESCAGEAAQESAEGDSHPHTKRSIDIDTYDRHKDKLRQGLTLLDIDRHSDLLEKFDVEGVLAPTERVLPRAADLWVQASLEQRHRLQQLFFPDGVVFDGMFERGKHSRLQVLNPRFTRRK
jgi:hypothetical protein